MCSTCIATVGAVVRFVWAADTVIAVGLITWLESVAMVPRVVMGVARLALAVGTLPPARLVEIVPVTVPRVVTPTQTQGENVRNPINWRKKIPKRASNLIIGSTSL